MMLKKVQHLEGIPSGENTGYYKYYLNIGSAESFEEKLEEAQKALGRDSRDYMPVTYASEIFWFRELMSFAPTMLLVGSLIFLGRGRSSGGRGTFSTGNAQIIKVDKDAKNKVYFKDVAGRDEAKQEIMEFVHFLKNPEKYELLGVKMP